jgi:pSer/pThr/pTyr-binding forkhead associated (FHA) protein
MFDRVILTGTEDALKGQKFVLENGASCVVGRAKDCLIQLPGELCMVSRHHCRIDVDGPHVRVRDLGSLNGTYVNGELIGRRDRDEQADESRWRGQPGRPLWDGDELQVGSAALRVEFDPPMPCAEEEPRDQKKLWTCDGVLC